MRRIVLISALAAGWTGAAQAQWQMQTSNTTADLRGIHSVGGGVAWASGTNGTVLRTEDGGYVWQTCAIPPGAEKLDFRGIQAFDANTAIVMSSGKGDLSRLYQTTDGCHTWKLATTNPDPDGFWDAVQADNAQGAVILGDAVKGRCKLWNWGTGGLEFYSWGKCKRGEGSFAASNSVLEVVGSPQVDPTWNYTIRFASEAKKRAYFTVVREERTQGCEPCTGRINKVGFYFADRSDNSGIFSFAFKDQLTGIIVGGDFKQPDLSREVAGTTEDGGISWHPAQTPPHGYRSSVAYDDKTKTWITVGPNGTDISSDHGRNWRAVHPNPALHEAPDADRNWNAISLPFVVGPHGRIGKLDPTALTK